MARREKKKKINLRIVVPVVCIVVVGVTFFMLHDIQKRIEKMDTENIVNQDENQIVESGNVEGNNQVEEDTVFNADLNASQNETTNTNVSTTNTKNNQNTTTSQPGITDKKQKAIALVKKEWGADDTVDYVFDYVNENGEYVIAVKDRATATVKYYFRVNLEKQTVEID